MRIRYKVLRWTYLYDKITILLASNNYFQHFTTKKLNFYLLLLQVQMAGEYWVQSLASACYC